MNPEKIIVNVYGACEPVNPGEIAAYGFVIKEESSTVHREKGVVGEGEGMTNNVTEYTAAIKALEWIQENCEATAIEMRADSQLLVRQVNGEYAVRSQRIRPLYQKLSSAIKKLEADFTIQWVPREKTRPLIRSPSRQSPNTSRLASTSGTDTH